MPGRLTDHPRPHPRPRRRAFVGGVVAAFAAAALVATACGGGAGRDDVGGGRDDRGTTGATSRDAAAAVRTALCAAAEAAAAGDVARARTTFEDVHNDLHAVADELGEQDRQAAADLLRAKQRVEAALAADGDPPEVGADLRTLAGLVASPSGGRYAPPPSRHPCG